MVPVHLSIYLFALHTISAQVLEGVISSTELPYGCGRAQPIYDGGDNIYILGCQEVSQIWKYSLVDESINYVATMRNSVSGVGAIAVGEQGIFTFGGIIRGFGLNRNITKISFDPYEETTINELSIPRTQESLVWDGSDAIYNIGGQLTSGFANYITKYSLINNNITRVETVLPDDRQVFSASWDNSTQCIYLFGGYMYPDILLDDIWAYHPSSDTMTKLNSTLPVGAYATCSLKVGGDIYVLGKFANFGQVAPLVRFNPATQEVSTQIIGTLPADITHHGCVYVPNLNRIYLFGGWIAGYQAVNITYINL